MKKIVKVLLLMFLIVAVTGCSEETQTQTQTATESQEASEKTEKPSEQPIRVAALKGPTAMGMAKLIRDHKEDPAYAFTLAAAPDEVIAGISKGEVDIACIPANAASVLFNKTGGKIQVACVNTLGVIYIVQNSEQIKAMEDLAGKTLYSTGKGQSQEHVLNYVLKEKEIEDVTVEYYGEHTELATLLAQEENVIALLPEPFITAAKLKNNKIQTVVSMTDEWNEITEGKSQLITGVAVVSTDFLENNAQAFEAFLQEYKNSVAFVNENNEEAAKIIGDLGIIDEKIALEALPKCNIVYLEGEPMKESLNAYLEVLFEGNPESIGGKMPTEQFYYEK